MYFTFVGYMKYCRRLSRRLICVSQPRTSKNRLGSKSRNCDGGADEFAHPRAEQSAGAAHKKRQPPGLNQGDARPLPRWPLAGAERKFIHNLHLLSPSAGCGAGAARWRRPRAPAVLPAPPTAPPPTGSSAARTRATRRTPLAAPPRSCHASGRKRINNWF